MLRIIEVIGAIVTQIKTGIAESRVYQQTSPRFAAPPILLIPPTGGRLFRP